MNATKDGLYSSRVIFETGCGREDRSELDALAKALIEHFAPVGEYEHFLVDKMRRKSGGCSVLLLMKRVIFAGSWMPPCIRSETA